MRILHVCNDYYPALGGIGVYVSNLCERLAVEHNVTVFSADCSVILPREEERNGVLVRRFPSFSPGNAYYFSFEMLRELSKSQFDIVHGHNYHAFPLFLSKYARKGKFIVSPHYHRHGTTSFRDILIRLYKPVGRTVFRDADRVIAASNYEKNLLIEDFDIDPDKAAVIPHGVNLADFRSLKKEVHDHKTILCVARLERFKGVQYIIQALPLLDEGIRLEIVGEGKYKRELIRLAAELGVEHRIGFYQPLYGKELLARYASADLFALLSEHENFGMVVAEARAAQLPCIVASKSALAEWVDNDSCFGIECPASCHQLAALIHRVIGSKVGDVKLRNWEDVAAETVRVYGE